MVELLASGGEDGSIHLWNLNRIQGIVGFNNLDPDRLLFGHLNTIHSVAFSPDSQRLASAVPIKRLRCGM
jgi:WD40 repeat protein